MNWNNFTLDMKQITVPKLQYKYTDYTFYK